MYVLILSGMALCLAAGLYSYPITISSQSVDMSGIMGTRGGRRENEVSAEENRTRVYADYSAIESSEEMASNIKENNLTAFKEYLDNPESEIHQYLGENFCIGAYKGNRYFTGNRCIETEYFTGIQCRNSDCGTAGRYFGCRCFRSADHPDYFGYPELIGRFGDFCFPPGYGGAALNPVKRGDYSHCRMDSFQKGGEERPGSGIAYRVTTRRFLCLKY